jgi:hypothetical protein
MTTFKKTCTAALAALTLSGAVLASAAPVEAGFDRRHGGAIAAGVVGGFALGAAIASQRPAYGYAPVYEAYGPVCTAAWEDGYDVYGQYFKRRVQICR